MIILLIWSIISCLYFIADAMIRLFGLYGIIWTLVFAAFLLLPAVFLRNTIKNFLKDDVKESLYKKPERLPKGWPYIAMAAGCVMLSLIALFVRPESKISAVILCAADVIMFWLIFGALLLACSYFRQKDNAFLEELEIMLGDFGIFRCHQSYLVSLAHVSGVCQAAYGRTYTAVLDSGDEIPVSRGKYPAMLAELKSKGIKTL